MPGLVTYEERLNRNTSWALLEGSMHFEEKSAVQLAMRRIAKRLDDIGVAYAVVGGMAMFFHGYRRFTEGVDLLVTKDGLRVAHDRLEGLGYLPPFEGSKHLRDTDSGVKIEFLTTGEYPGDGLVKPVAFPDPAAVRVERDGVWYLQLATLVELKLASGMTHPRRGKDINDVEALIEARGLGEDLADRLNPFVRDKYLELVRLIRANPTKPD